MRIKDKIKVELNQLYLFEEWIKAPWKRLRRLGKYKLACLKDEATVVKHVGNLKET